MKNEEKKDLLTISINREQFVMEKTAAMRLFDIFSSENIYKRVQKWNEGYAKSFYILEGFKPEDLTLSYYNYVLFIEERTNAENHKEIKR